jgi:hypothetical protein
MSNTDPDRKSPRHVLTEEERADRDQRIIAAVKAGTGLTAIARRFKLAPDTVRRVCAEHGVPAPARQWSWA